MEKKIIFLSKFYKYQKLYGSFQKILKTRKIFLKLIEKQEPQKKNIDEIISAKIELGKFNQLNEKYYKFTSKEFADKYKLLINFFKSREEPFPRLFNNKFLEFIKNKSIAIVGPADSKIDNGDEIDNYDIVVRINILISGEESIKIDSKKMGSRTDIIYYNSDMVLRWKNNIFNSKNEVWIVFKDKKFYDDYLNFSKTERASYQSTLSFIKDPTGASAMMIPNVIFDLLKYNPKKIKIFNTNFYFDGFNYIDGIKKKINIKRNESYFVKEFRKHDAFFNYNLIKNLFQNQKIEIDKVGEKALKVDTRTYSKELDKHFEKFTY